MKNSQYNNKNNPLSFKKNKLVALFLLPLFTHAADEKKLVQHNNRFEIKLNKSKIIYQEEFGSQGTSVDVSNMGKKTMLLKSGTLTEDKKSRGPYIIAPPLLLLNPGEHASLSINLIKNKFNNNQEQMNWACFTALPPKNIINNDNDKKNINLDINLSINTCIKIIYRPKSVASPMKIDSSSISWKYKNGEITALNNTPYYIPFSKIKGGGNELNSIVGYVSPHQSITMKAPSNLLGKPIEWQSYDDFGSVIGPFSSQIN